MTIERMEDRHIAEIAEIEKACFEHPWSAEGLRAELGRGLFFAAVEDGTTVGYAGCQTVLDEGYITNVAVLPSFRRRGIAEQLLRELIRQAKGLSFLTLEVRSSNDAAAALYEKMGFQRVGVRKNFYSAPQENAVLMTRYL